MLIARPSCATSYFVEPASLQPNGRRVRRRCVWRNESTRAARLMDEGLAPDAFVPDAVVAQWQPNSQAAPAQFPKVPVEVAAAGEPIHDAPDAPPVVQKVAERGPGSWSRRRRRSPSNATLRPSCQSISTGAGRPSMSTPRRYGRKPAPIIRTSRPLRRAASAAAPSDGSTRGGYPSGSIPILEQITLNPVVVGCCKDIVRLLPRTTSFYATIDPSVELSRRAWDGVSTRAEQHKGVPCRWCRPIVNETGGWSKCRD
jgi:hypothetical protein